MSVTIETTEELLALLRKLNVKISSVEELRSLLATINAHYNPQAARVRTAKLVALSVPCGLGSIAGVVSLLLTTTQSLMVGSHFVAALALIWGSFALVSVTALIFSFALLLGRHARASVDAPPLPKSSALDERVVTALRHDLSL